MSVFSIENQFIKASFNSNGAELLSLINHSNQEELIWQADATFWPRHAPILFPVVGRLKDNEYEYSGVKYQMNQHGFARDSLFEVEKHTKTEIIFLLSENENTLLQFPFRFQFRVVYYLQENSLKQQFIANNTDSKIMYCSFGGHPAFNTDPISAYQLKFNPIQLEQRLYSLKDGSICTQTKPFQLDEIKLNETLFDSDALIFENTENMSITLFKEKEPILEISTCDMPHLGIWSKPKAPFVCIEPWQGWADLDNHNGELHLKSGIIEIAPGEQCQRYFEIRVC